ncbi:hypothetical protein [Shewanella sp. KT0246]|uniref:hypothetical protein n=1 Tax=Shewanella sp. KT0246 TaxID=2815912 RepID=UPI001BBF3D0A|nr:hypothetical protein [Shewanella sp. KT0246]GIU53171.1 hypothetical protein TUM4249_28120 [Shewanella sp. KT0246]
MKKLIATIAFTLTLTVAPTIQADVLAPISSTYGHVKASLNFDMTHTENFKASNGLEIKIHASKSDDNRVLVMDSSWSPFAYLTSGITETNAKEAAMEYANTKSIDVQLSNPEEYHHNGSYGYAFNVETK